MEVIRRDQLLRSGGLEFSTSVLEKLYRAWDPRIAQGGQVLLETVQSVNATIGANSTVDTADPSWAADPKSLDFGGDDIAPVNEATIPVPSPTWPSLLHCYLGYFVPGSQTVEDMVGTTDAQLGTTNTTDNNDPAWQLSPISFVFGSDDLICFSSSLTQARY